MNALECRSLTKQYGDQVALADVDLEVEAGEVVALVGFNGAGKSTLMRLALGMQHSDAGSVNVLGSDIAGAPAPVWAQVGHLVETPFAYPELTVRENLWAAARLHGVARRAAAAAAAGVIDRLDLVAWADRRAGTLSLGNRQRVGLAAALVHDPRLLVLDEPTNALDPAGVVLLRDVVRERAEAGVAVLVSSHHLDEVARVADRVAVIHGGRLIGELPVDGADLERQFFAMAHEADRAQDGAVRGRSAAAGVDPANGIGQEVA